MARSRHSLTVEVQQTIAAYIRAGGFAHVAAAAAESLELSSSAG